MTHRCCRYLKSSTDQLNAQTNATDDAFNTRLAETSAAKDLDESNLAKTRSELVEQAQSISDLERLIKDQDGPLKMAETRLNTRCVLSQSSLALCRSLSLLPVSLSLARSLWFLFPRPLLLLALSTWRGCARPLVPVECKHMPEPHLPGCALQILTTLSIAIRHFQNRSRRPNVELVHDPAQDNLIAEVNQIVGVIEKLNLQKSEAEAAHRALVRVRHLYTDASCLWSSAAPCSIMEMAHASCFWSSNAPEYIRRWITLI